MAPIWHRIQRGVGGEEERKKERKEGGWEKATSGAGFHWWEGEGRGERKKREGERSRWFDGGGVEGEGDEEGEKIKTAILGKEPSHALCSMIEPSKLIVGNLNRR